MKRERYALIVLLLFVWCAAGHAVSLRYNLRAGETLQYQTKLQGQGTIVAMGRTDPVVMSGSMLHQQQVRSVDARGNATILISVLNQNLQATWAGKPLPVSATIPPMTIVMTPTGQIVSCQLPQSAAGGDAAALGQLGQLLGGAGGLGALGGTDPMGFDLGKFFASMQNLGFPPGDVRQGQTWSDQTTISTPSGQQIPIKSSSRLEGLTMYAGRRCARITTQYTIPLTFGVPQIAQGFQIGGSQSGANRALFDVTSGRLLHSEGTVASQISMSAPDLRTGGTTQVSMSLNLGVQTDLISRPAM